MVQLSDYNTFFEYRIQWGQMDAAQHINNLEYLRWAESARVEYFDKIGISVDFGTSDLAPILGWQECKYIFPITYPDIALVGIKTTEIMSDRLMLETSVFSKKYERIACVSKQSIVPYDYIKLTKVSLPGEWVERIKNYEKW